MRLLLFLSFLLIISITKAQTNKTLLFEGQLREYKEYVPPIYNGNTAVPVVFCLHGLGDNMNNFNNIGMNYIADTANFIVITPQAMNSMMGNAWNSGASSYGIVLNGNINDVGFIHAIIDSLDQEYNIDFSRIYSCGFSMGGFMSNRLACESTDKFAAIASVAGTIGNSLQCNPWGNIPVCHFHGTNDSVVKYINNDYGIDAEDLVNYWLTYNNCDTQAIHTVLPDLVADGKTVEHFYYGNGNNNSCVEFYKINGGDHEWLFYPQNDISYTILIWEFFRKHSKTPTSIQQQSDISNIEVFPNPASSYITVKSNFAEQIEIYNLQGKLIFSQEYTTEKNTINIQDFSPGLYILKLYGNASHHYEKLIIQ
jgi:polyhydroxybutyrate depolymerase